MRKRFLENGHDGLEVADGAPDEVLHVESTSWGSIDLIRPRCLLESRHFDFVIVLCNSETRFTRPRQGPGRRGGPSRGGGGGQSDVGKDPPRIQGQSELQIFQITQISQLNQGYFLKVMKTHEVYPLQGRKKVNNNCEFEMRMKMSVPLEGVVMEESKLEVLVCPW